MSHKSVCPACMGACTVYAQVGVDTDSYPLYRKTLCPLCSGTGSIDLSELFVVPRAMVLDEFFVSEEYTASNQSFLRKALAEEEKYLEKSSKPVDKTY